MGLKEKQEQRKKLKAEQEKETNTKKAKKRDYRAWANKWLKPGALPPVTSGFGEGKVLYCSSCDVKVNKATYKNEWTCNVCGTPCISMTRTEFELFRQGEQ